jgi:sterol desaturase/sphingolipid hydroxylase (fatty acid hydroxylase superfamily)
MITFASDLVSHSEEMPMLNLITQLFDVNLKLPTTLSGEHVAIILLIFFGLFSSLEILYPRQKWPAKKLRQSYITNSLLLAVNSTLMSLLSVSALFLLAQRYAHQGLLQNLENPIWQAILSFVLLDLLLYAWHWACHRFDGLWMFHRVHHNDPYLNTSTAFRIHALELLSTNLLKAAYIGLLGIEQMMVLINEAVITFFIMFHHTNISFKGENLVGRLIIVPYLHLAHHSTERREHDCNYGAVLAIWDRLFGTSIEVKPAVVGIHGKSPQTLLELIKFGFYMPKAAPSREPVPANLENMIAEAAYYKAEKRNFRPGNELLDWLEAKREIITLVYGDSPAIKRQAQKPKRNYFKLTGFNINQTIKQSLFTH